MQAESLQAESYAEELKAAEPSPLPERHPLQQQEASSSARIEGIKGLLSESEVLQKVEAAAELASKLKEHGRNANREPPENELPEAKEKATQVAAERGPPN